ncbi:MAG: CDP-archaeol synthase [Myxococcales bacterium]|nr:CDP-archaeol synthase [Myxococcales bacterium]
MADFIRRLWVAILLIPVLVAGLYLDPTPYSILIMSAIATMFAHDEFLRMALPVRAEDGEMPLRVVVVLGLGGAIHSLPMLVGPARALPPLLTFSVVVVAATTLLRRHHLPSGGRHMAACLASLVYVPLLASVWPLIKHDFGPGWLFLTLALAFLSDTVAYIFGRLWGRHKLYPAVSPGKTWEGSLGGVVGGVLAAVGFGSLLLVPELPVLHALVLGVLASLFGQVGDLFESMLKRSYGVKDSSSLLGAHGGMLDRVDALLFVGPVVYYYNVLVLR